MKNTSIKVPPVLRGHQKSPEDWHGGLVREGAGGEGTEAREQGKWVLSNEEGF